MDVWSVLAKWGSNLRNPQDEFFTDGNRVAEIDNPIYCNQIDDEEFYHKDYPQFSCDECEEMFNQLIDYENHYNNVHKFTCKECRESFPSLHLLDLHLLETHDTFFKLLAQRNPSYQCWLQTCTQKFKTKELRRDHAIQTHQFPPDFKFDDPIDEKRKSWIPSRNSKVTLRSPNKSSPSKLPRPRRPLSIASFDCPPEKTYLSDYENTSSHSTNSKEPPHERRSSLSYSPRKGGLSLATMGENRPESSLGSSGSSLTNSPTKIIKPSRIPIRSFSYKNISFGRDIEPTFDKSSYNKFWHQSTNQKSKDDEMDISTLGNLHDLKSSLPGIIR